MIFSRAGFNALKFAYVVLIAGLGVGIFIVVGSYFYGQAEKKNDLQGQRSLQDLRKRLNTAIRDREDLRGSEDTYKMLAARGVFIPEERFDLIESLAALKARHQLISLTYEVAQQRPLRLGDGAAYSGVNLFASRVKLKIGAFHDGNLIAFLDEFPRLQRGFFPIDYCSIKRNALPQAAALLENNATRSVASPTSPTVIPAAPLASIAIITPALAAECSFDWITLQAKGSSVIAPTATSSAPITRSQ